MTVPRDLLCRTHLLSRWRSSRVWWFRGLVKVNGAQGTELHRPFSTNWVPPRKNDCGGGRPRLTNWRLCPPDLADSKNQVSIIITELESSWLEIVGIKQSWNLWVFLRVWEPFLGRAWFFILQCKLSSQVLKCCKWTYITSFPLTTMAYGPCWPPHH